MSGSLRKLRKKVLKREGYTNLKTRCVYCGIIFNDEHEDSKRYPTIDHVMPKTLGLYSKYDVKNCVLCCQNCNNSKGNMLPLEFIYNIACSLK